MSDILSINGVNKTFGGLKALSGVHLNIKKGETHAIIGPNGAGKSTLLNCCIGRLIPDSGSVTFNGQNMIGMSPYDINHAGMVRVFQTPEIFPELNVLQNVMIPAFSKRDGVFTFNPFKMLTKETKIRNEALAVLADFELEKYHDTVAGSLSRGDKRRLELAMGLIQHPVLLLLDEPTAGMARHDTNRTIDLLKSEKMRKMTKVIIEHDMHVVFSLADRISVLARGQVIATGTPDEIKNDPTVKAAYLGEESHDQ
ncbi:MAG: ABC transporter ATP-binding protein [Cocleimonas sp.]|nr:ABC transporter ATP-binding protein [Cocleimonas sp.]